MNSMTGLVKSQALRPLGIRVRHTSIGFAWLISLCTITALVTSSYGQTNRTWDGSSSTAWATGQNWSNNNVPNAATEVALFANATARDPASYGTAFTIGGFNLTGGEARSLTFTNTIALGQYGVDNASTFDLSISGAGTTTLSAAQTWSISNSGNTTFAKVIANGGNLLTLDSSSSGIGTISTAISGNGGLTKIGSGTWILSGTNTYIGATTITTGALQIDGSTGASSTLGIGTAGTLTGTGTVNGNATLTGGGIINKSAGTIVGTLAVTGGDWNGAGAVTGVVTSSSGTFTIGAGANLTANGNLNVTGGSIVAGNSSSTITGSVNYTSGSNSNFVGVIAGSGKTLTLNNAATTLTLSGNNSYTGTTTVSAGTLVVNGDQSAATGATIISGAGSRLGGSGTLGGNLTIESGAIHGVGNSPGLQTINGATNYNAGSIFEWDLAANVDTAGGGVRGADYDAVNMNGAFTVQSGAIFKVVQNSGVDFSTAFWEQDREWSDIFDVNGAVNGWATDTLVGIYNTAGTLQDFSAYGSFTISGTTLNWTTAYNAIPEPTSALAGLLMIFGLLRRRRPANRSAYLS
jgi:autotransporter-associated beta strand protein